MRIREEALAGEQKQEYCSIHAQTLNTHTTIVPPLPTLDNNALVAKPPANKATFPTDAAAREERATLS